MKRIVVISNEASKRLNYVLTFLMSVWEVEIELNATDIADNDFVINYGNTFYTNPDVTIPNEKLLFEKNIEIVDFEVGYWEELKTIFHSNTENDISFDLFSAIFYLLSRYEEYLPHKKDEHDRYLLKNSILYKEKVSHLPIVDLWLKKFYNCYLNKLGVSYKVNFSIMPTFDIDIAYSHKGKGIVRTFGAVGKSLLKLNASQLKKRFKTSVLKHPDPYDTFSFIKKSLNHQSAIYFFQVGRFGKYDKNLSIKNSLMKNLIRSLSDNKIGLHPSYQSNSDIRLLYTEKQDLEQVLQKQISQSRQHYLKLEFPDTYQNLLSIGITDDYTMGYAEEIAFRAGTSYAFKWFNLVEDKVTNLTIHPISIMDVTLKNYRCLKPDKALEEVKKIKEIIKNVKGTFIPLWHNNSISFLEEWKNWETVYFECLKD